MVKIRERRVTQIALKAWISARRNGSVPHLNDLSGNGATTGKIDLFSDNQFLIKADFHTVNSVFMFYGNALPKVRGRRNVGESVQSFLPAAMKDIFNEACEVTANKDKEVYREGEITTASGEKVLYRCIFMPLRSDSLNYQNYIFGAFSNETGATDLLAA